MLFIQYATWNCKTFILCLQLQLSGIAARAKRVSQSMSIWKLLIVSICIINFWEKDYGPVSPFFLFPLAHSVLADFDLKSAKTECARNRSQKSGKQKKYFFNEAWKQSSWHHSRVILRSYRRSSLFLPRPVNPILILSIKACQALISMFDLHRLQTFEHHS